MDQQSWMKFTMQQSAALGLEVLRRASSRRMDWTNIDSPQAPAAPEENAQSSVKMAHTELQGAFATIKKYMILTSHHCERYYDSNCCTDPTESERTHMSRFHPQPEASWTESPELADLRELDLPTCKKVDNESNVSPVAEDFQIVVSPGSYAVTACITESRQQTHEVNISAGESIKLTFEL